VGLIGAVLEFLRSVVDGFPIADVKIDTGGEDNATAELFQPAGFDGQPLEGDTAGAMAVPGADRAALVGFIDQANAGTAGPGEARLYARDADGAIVATILISADGIVNLGDDVAAELIARADRVEAELAKIAQDFTNLNTKYDAHSHAAMGADPPSNKPLGSAYTSNGAVGCDKVKGT
jgi:hypothetical protein